MAPPPTTRRPSRRPSASPEEGRPHFPTSPPPSVPQRGKYCLYLPLRLERKTGFEPADPHLGKAMTSVGLRPLVPLSRVFTVGFSADSAALDELVHPDTRGNPMSLLRWTSKSSSKLAADLVAKGFEVSSRTVLRLLHLLGYSLQANAKVLEGAQHPDRDSQFRYLNDMAEGFVDDGEPVISVDTKKKELVGNYANGGTEWALAGEPVEVNDHDFPDQAVGKAVPYGIYDVINNEAGSRSAIRRTRPSSRSNRSGDGGDRWARSGPRKRLGC